MREVARHAGGAVVVPVRDDGRLVMIRQHRYPLDEVIWELPAGKLDRGEEPLACARRELAEETGHVASEWTLLNSIYTTPGFCDEVLHIYLARGISRSPAGRAPEEGEESMTVHEIPMDEAVAMISRMEIRDGKSICGILQAAPLVKTAPTGGGGERLYRTSMEKCVRPGCAGRPVELSHYERNNWATSEMQCNTCRTRFTVKLEI